MRGSGRLPYQVSAGVRRLGTGRLAIGGECSCPVGLEQGVKMPSGPAAKLLDIVDRKGLATLATE